MADSSLVFPFKMSIKKRGGRKADLDFTAGLILTMLLIAAIAVSCTNIFKESMSGRPGARFEQLVNAVKEIQNKPAGSTDVVLGYLTGRHAILGFTSTASRIQKSAVIYDGSNIKEFFTAFIAPRPSACPYGKSCICLIEDPKVELEEIAPASAARVLLTWKKEQCVPLENANGTDFYNTNVLEEEEKYFGNDYLKGGFIITRGENIGGDFELARGVGFYNIPQDPQITIEKTEQGIAVCVRQPCTRRGMDEQQKLFVEANKKFREAEKAYEDGQYAAAEQAFNDLLLMEAQQQGHGFPGSIMVIEDPAGKRKEGVELVLNAREHDAMYIDRAESMAKQRKYDEAIAAFNLAEIYATEPALQNRARTNLETLDCTLRSFASCTTNEPREICYQDTDDKTCRQCTPEKCEEKETTT